MLCIIIYTDGIVSEYKENIHIKWPFFRGAAKLYIPSTPNNSNETHTLCVWAEPAVLGSTKTALKFKYKI